MNVGSDMVRIHKGTKLRRFTPMQHVHVIDDQEMFTPDVQAAVDLQSVDMSASTLNSTQRTKLMKLIKEFGDTLQHRKVAILGVPLQFNMKSRLKDLQFDNQSNDFL